MHIKFVKCRALCPKCKAEPDADKTIERIAMSKNWYVRVTCACGHKYGATMDMVGDVVGFELNTINASSIPQQRKSKH